MNTQELADAAQKIGEGWHELAQALARLGDPEGIEPEAPEAETELDISGSTNEGRRRRQAIVLHALEQAGGRMHKDAFYRIAQSVGYDNRGLAGFSTVQANLVQVEHGEGGTDSGYRVLTDKGRRRLEVNRHLLPPE
ncbi:hypothetical protein [Blastococcus sp. VKM Ac-2987]|uniref:hypothetical protein n=1 Tax=Blastococcus sp. VKM Ac-2987 TaxID=3004141 RepID=UPI0022ABA148|nr:hypothetical protein [Blastococcus sp. VKM Ac-2987]MCZ2859190.1 hypothetical protein [Blastococcus sp. VKM Ac-2987]